MIREFLRALVMTLGFAGLVILFCDLVGLLVREPLVRVLEAAGGVL